MFSRRKSAPGGMHTRRLSQADRFGIDKWRKCGYITISEFLLTRSAVKTNNSSNRRCLDRFLQACKQAGVRVTPQRIAVYQAVADTDDHPDVETVFAAVRRSMPTVSLDTVYRTLWLLRDLGIVSTLGPPRERTRFDANTRRHHHFVCSRCGLAKDIYCPEFDDLVVPEVVKAVGTVESTHVELRGLCSDCSMLVGEKNADAEQRRGGTR